MFRSKQVLTCSAVTLSPLEYTAFGFRWNTHTMPSSSVSQLSARFGRSWSWRSSVDITSIRVLYTLENSVDCVLMYQLAGS